VCRNILRTLTITLRISFPFVGGETSVGALEPPHVHSHGRRNEIVGAIASELWNSANLQTKYYSAAEHYWNLVLNRRTGSVSEIVHDFVRHGCASTMKRGVLRISNQFPLIFLKRITSRKAECISAIKLEILLLSHKNRIKGA